MSKYQSYWFVNLPLAEDLRPAGSGIEDNSAPYAMSYDFADLVEMLARRYLIATLPRYASVSKTDIRNDCENLPDLSRFLSFNFDNAGTLYRLPKNKAAGKFDAADDSTASFLNPTTDILTNCLGEVFNPYYKIRSGDMWPKGILSEISNCRLLDINRYDNIGYNFISADYVLPSTWGTVARGSKSYAKNIDYTTVAGPSVNVTRFTVPDRAFFYAVSDAIAARPLRDAEDYEWEDDNGQRQTTHVSVPYYELWYDPNGNACYNTRLSNVRLPIYGKYAFSNFSYHTEDAFKFKYDSRYATDDPNINLKLLVKHLPNPSGAVNPYLVTDAANYTAYPNLNTTTSWWESEGLGVDLVDTLMSPGACKDAVKAFYVAPSLFPATIRRPPLDNSWTPTEGYNYLYDRFFSEIPFAATIKHAMKFMGKLSRVCFKIEKLRVGFSSSSTTTREKTVTGSGTTRNTVTYKSEGWANCNATGSTNLPMNDGSFGGFSLQTELPSGDSYQNAKAEFDNNGTVTSITESFAMTASVSSIIPLSDSSSTNAYDYTTRATNTDSSYDSGDVRQHNNEDANIVPFIPVWGNVLISAASLYLVCECEIVTSPSRSGTASVDSSLQNPYEGQINYNESVVRAKRAIKIADGTIRQGLPIEFIPDNGSTLASLLDSVLSGSEFYVDLNEGNVRNGTGSLVINGSKRTYTYDDKETVLHRNIENASLFMVVDFNPDVNGAAPWSS